MSKRKPQRARADVEAATSEEMARADLLAPDVGEAGPATDCLATKRTSDSIRLPRWLMKKWFAVLSVFAALFLASGISAQENPMPTGFPMPRFTLTMRPDVSGEIKFSKDQQGQLMTKMKGAGQMGMAMPMPGGRMSGDYEPFKKLESEIQPIFSAAQWSRLTELWIQFEGAFVLTDGAMAEALKLTESQRSQIDSVVEQFSEESSELMGHIRGKGDMKRIHDQAVAACEKIVALLTEEQSAQFRTMQGRKFTFRN